MLLVTKTPSFFARPRPKQLVLHRCCKLVERANGSSINVCSDRARAGAHRHALLHAPGQLERYAFGARETRARGALSQASRSREVRRGSCRERDVLRWREPGKSSPF